MRDQRLNSEAIMIKEILVFHHSHLDVGYTHSQPVVWELQQEYLSQVVSWLESTGRGADDRSIPRWTCEATDPVLRWIERSPPALVNRFVALCQSGRIGLTALARHITALADRRGLQRLIAGKSRLEELTSRSIKTACQFDVNGVPWPMADVLIDQGVDFFVMAINAHLGRAVTPRPGFFLWEAPSGRSLLVMNGNHYTMFDQILRSWDNSIETMQRGWDDYARHLQSISYPYDFIALSSTCSPIMWDNAPPNPFLPPLLDAWNKEGRMPEIRYATLDEVRDRAGRIDRHGLPKLRGDWTDFWSFGVASAPIATARSRQTKPILDALASLRLSPEEHSAVARATHALDLYDEHTFGYFNSHTDQAAAQTTEILKQALAHEAYELANFSLMSALDRLAGNAVADLSSQRVIAVNPSDEPTTIDLPERDNDPAKRSYRASRLMHSNRAWEVRHASPKAVEVPARSWTVLDESLQFGARAAAIKHHTLREGTSEGGKNQFTPTEVELAAALPKAPSEAVADNGFVRLRYQPATGHIFALHDVAQDRDLIGDSSLGLFAYVRERPNALIDAGYSAFYLRDLDREKIDASCWRDWTPVRERSSRTIDCRVEADGDRFVLRRNYEAPGAILLRDTVALYAGDPTIHLSAELLLEPRDEPQNIYFAIPLSLDKGWGAAFDTAGANVRLDLDQLPGSCRNWATAENYAAIWDAKGGVALFLDEAPNVQFGDYHFSKPLDVIPRRRLPLLLAWPISNCWETNFPRQQSGHMRFRFGLRSFVAPDLSEIERQARAFRRPNLVWPVSATGRSRGSGTI
jgi:alpha-mannosidase